MLSTLRGLGADATICLDKPGQDLTEAFTREAGDAVFDVIIDYLWGLPTEALLAAMTRAEFAAADIRDSPRPSRRECRADHLSSRRRAARSRALTILGTAGIPPGDILVDAFWQVMTRAARGQLRIDTERIPLADIEDAWQRQDRQGRKLVITP